MESISPSDDERPGERADVLAEIRIAEEQIARGDGIEHEAAKRQVLACLCRDGQEAKSHRQRCCG